jgi:phospholipase C
VLEPNISPWRRAVAGDLTSMFDFSKPDDRKQNLPTTADFLPPVDELAGGNVNTFIPSLGTVTLGVPSQERGVRPARALPYELNAHATVDASKGTVTLTFFNSGRATVVFQVRSVNPADLVRTYTVEPFKQLADTWNVKSSYDLSVYGPNGFVRYFKGSIGSSAATLDVSSRYHREDFGSFEWRIVNTAANPVKVNLLDAYTGNSHTDLLQPGGAFEHRLSLRQFYGWYDLIVTVASDSTFSYRLAGHVETGRDSFSDPALGGLVSLKG